MAGRGFELVKDVAKYKGKAKLPEYQTRLAAGADFFAATDVVVKAGLRVPTRVPTGVKAFMEDDEGLYLLNRSSNPKKKGLVVSNGVGLVDADYYENEDNDGEIMVDFYNTSSHDVLVKAGDRVMQGVFSKILRPTNGLGVKSDKRKGGFGSTEG